MIASRFIKIVVYFLFLSYSFLCCFPLSFRITQIERQAKTEVTSNLADPCVTVHHSIIETVRSTWLCFVVLRYI